MCSPQVVHKDPLLLVVGTRLGVVVHMDLLGAFEVAVPLAQAGMLGGRKLG